MHASHPGADSGSLLDFVDPATLQPHPANPRAHSKKQIRQIADSIRAFGFKIPVVIDAASRLICGHARVEAAKLAGIKRVPCLRVTDLSEDQIRGLMIADNRLTDLSSWDDQLLGENLKFLSNLDLDFQIESLGFEYGEIEQRILGLEGDGHSDDGADDLPDPTSVLTVTRPGDVWRLGDADNGHLILCGDSTAPDSYERLLGDRRAAMIFADPPYNLPARTIGQVCAGEHGDFAMGSGEMSPSQFQEFLGQVMERLCRFSEPGSIHYYFMDWRHASDILAAGHLHYSELKNLCVWVKDRPGMGAFYRSQHELIFVFKYAVTRHQNNFGLGQHGRTRSNVWCYPSARSFNGEDGDPENQDALGLHPTIKPVRLIEAAILDCSRRGEIVLDPFLGSGSTLIACEKSGRVLAGIEIAPRYIDTTIVRWQNWTKRDAVHPDSGASFAELGESRRKEQAGE